MLDRTKLPIAMNNDSHQNGRTTNTCTHKCSYCPLQSHIFSLFMQWGHHSAIILCVLTPFRRIGVLETYNCLSKTSLGTFCCKHLYPATHIKPHNSGTLVRLILDYGDISHSGPCKEDFKYVTTKSSLYHCESTCQRCYRPDAFSRAPYAWTYAWLPPCLFLSQNIYIA